MKLPELREYAQNIGIRGISGKRKNELIELIMEVANGGAPHQPARAGRKPKNAKNVAPAAAPAVAATPEPAAEPAPTRGRRRAVKRTADEAPQTVVAAAEAPAAAEPAAEAPAAQQPQSASQQRRARRQQQKKLKGGRPGRGNRDQEAAQKEHNHGDQQAVAANEAVAENGGQEEQNRGKGPQGRRGNRQNHREQRADDRDQRQEKAAEEHDEEEQQQQPQNNNIPVAGILDIVDNNIAFVRTTGYQPAANDVYVSPQLIRRCGLRRGDAVVGSVRPPRDNNHNNGRNNRQRYNALVRVEAVNGVSVEEARERAEFSKLIPLYPNQRLRLEMPGEKGNIANRVIDLVMPIGKGQRALIVSPPKAGKTTILKGIANAITQNNPECYLMVVLVDERPEEVTDMQRSVKGEVIASTFDRPPAEHTQVAELAIERAKRLVEMGRDVVVLLDSITRLGRAYNNSSPASGRILSGGVDSSALYPPKRFLGAARNIENGGSLTIIATAMVETGSAGDTVIFEEFKGTGNAELKLDRRIAERRVFPAVDINPSGTRKDELLMPPEEFRIVHNLRQVLSQLDPQAAIDLLLGKLRKTPNNRAFLEEIAKSGMMADVLEEMV